MNPIRSPSKPVSAATGICGFPGKYEFSGQESIQGSGNDNRLGRLGIQGSENDNRFGGLGVQGAGNNYCLGGIGVQGWWVDNHFGGLGIQGSGNDNHLGGLGVQGAENDNRLGTQRVQGLENDYRFRGLGIRALQNDNRFGGPSGFHRCSSFSVSIPAFRPSKWGKVSGGRMRKAGKQEKRFCLRGCPPVQFGLAFDMERGRGHAAF
jgi:hypothetical protein